LELPMQVELKNGRNVINAGKGKRPRSSMGKDNPLPEPEVMGYHAGYGRKLEYLKRTHACMKRICKLHAERPQARSQTQNLLAPRQQFYQLHHRAVLLWSNETKIKLFVAEKITWHVFGLWEEAGVPGENPRMHRENMQKDPRLGIEPRTFLLQGNSAINCATVQPVKHNVLKEKNEIKQRKTGDGVMGLQPV
ncbi:hypothetical protein ILYODFUR_004808, partial [Ilyodon furcidens]